MFDYIDCRKEAMNDFYEIEMQRYKETVVHVISRSAHSKVTQHLTKIFASSYFEENKDAITLANELDLDKAHFFAILDDIDGFKREYSKELELAQNF